MAKVLNQLLYSSVVFGSDQPAGVLRLESTSSGTKGPVEVVGTRLDLIINTVIGSLVHSNSSARTYTFPDYSGDVLISGLFTDANQLLYSSAAGVYAMLPNAVGGALVTSPTGAIQWVAGADDQVLTLVAGTPVFADLPDTGFINPSLAGDQIAYYAVAGNDISPLTTVASRTLLSTGAGALEWGLIAATYLKASGGVPLGSGLATQVLTAVGDGSFEWVDKNPAVINAGNQYRLPYYSVAPAGTTISQSTFIETDETARALKLINRGSLRFYEATVNGLSYLEFKAPVSLGPTVTWTLPATDGLPTPTHPAVLHTDGFGNLAFGVFDHGTVNAGLTNQIAYYAADGNDVSGLTTTASRILTSSALGVPTWKLLVESFLATTGDVPLGAGALNQVLVSDGATRFNWANAVDITGEVLAGEANFLAYYPTTNTKVDDTSFLSVDNTLKIFNLLAGAELRFFPATGTDYIGFTAPTLSATTTWKLPAEDGSDGYALTTDGLGNLSFIEVGRGVVNVGTPNTLAYYQAAEDAVYPWANVADRVALTTDANEIDWGLLTTKYFSKAGGGALDVGSPNFSLTPDGLGSFEWVDMTTVVGKVNLGQATRLAFYATASNEVSGSVWLNNVDGSKALEFLDGGSLRFYNSGSTYYAALTAPALTDNVTWKLPLADGSLGQFLITDGLGNLSWVTNKINTGTVSAIPYYSDLNEISASTLLIPAGLPASVGHILLVDHTTGQLSYEILVEPAGTAGQIAVYTDTQKVGYYSALTWDNASKLLKVGTGGGLVLFEATDTYSTTLKASPSLTASTTLTLPPELPAENGYVVTSETDGTLSFKEPSSDTRWEKRGVISLLPGMRSVTVIYDTPFDQVPSWINLQWVIGEDSSYLPTYAVEKSTIEGFVVRFSTAIPATGTYQLNWQSHVSAVTTANISLFIVGGRDVSGYLDLVWNVLVDVGTTLVLAATMSSPRSYTCGGGSSMYGYILGGSSSVPLPLGIITSYEYSTGTLSDLGATLITSRSGAAGVGTRSKVYVAGGETPGGANYSSIETFSTASETVSSFGPTLASSHVSKGAATSHLFGAIFYDGSTALGLLDYTLETLGISVASFGFSDIAVGANDAANSNGYFGRDSGNVYRYAFLTDTITALPSSLNSVAGLSSAGNSLDQAYFSGSEIIDALDFSTDTIQTVTNLVGTGHMSAASSTFQSKGLV